MLGRLPACQNRKKAFEKLPSIGLKVAKNQIYETSMKTQLEPEDAQIIAEKVFELLKPYLSSRERSCEDILFDVPGLCEYLHVNSHWVHERTHLKQIPYCKLSNKQLRFKKKDIDKWLESLKTSSINDFRGKIKIIK